jgi:hypothetical protein
VLDHDDLTKGLRPVGQPRWVEMSESHKRAMSALQVGSHAPWQVKVVGRAAQRLAGERRRRRRRPSRPAGLGDIVS